MAQRIRSILIDNTLGKIFTNTDTSSNADSSKLIAGTKLQSYLIGAASTVTTSVARNLGTGAGIAFSNAGIVVAVTLTAAVSPLGQATIVAIKTGSTYATSTVATTVTLPPGQNTVVASSLAISMTAGKFVYVDITQVGNQRPGTGLSIRVDYYIG